MADRTIVPLLFGAGLDRATGIFSREGRSGYDLRNVHLYRDKAMLRHGHQRANLLVDEFGAALQDVVLVTPMSAEQIGLLGGFGADGRVHLFRVSGDGTGLARIGVAFTLAAGAHSPPRLLPCEQFSKVFVAHDEAVRSLRAATVYYDPFGAPALKTLTADLDGDGTPGDVLFRGVAPYLTYTVGWGFGTETDPDEPHIVRVSDPEDPTLFSPDDYFLAGTGGSPVLNCLPAGTPDNSCLLAFKPTQIHQIFGYDRNTFGIRQIEDGRGIPASRLAISLGGVVYFWDPEGPRRSSGGPSEDLAWPLDLDAPSPQDLAAEGALADGFAVYLPRRRAILFIFGRRVYVLSLWDAGALKWSYGELAFAAQSGGILYSGLETPTTAPTGAASSVALTATSDTTLHAAWDNNDLTGGEVAELWLHAITADTWTLALQAAASGATQTADLVGEIPGTDYELQVRYRRGPYYRADYQSADPADWPAGSLSNTQATTVAAPALVSTTWSRVSAIAEQVHLVFTGYAALGWHIYRNAVQVGTAPAGATTYDHVMPNADGEQLWTYTVRQFADVESGDSNAIDQWAGPTPAPADANLGGGIVGGNATIGWALDYDGMYVQVRDDAQGLTYYDLTHVIPAPAEPGAVFALRAVDGGPIPNPVNPGDIIRFSFQQTVTTFGVEDFSPPFILTVPFAL